ncbi:MAG TPA: hypothetical protein PLA68_14885 [Panacibacter sp.]|nr:hypothetical protein [Panacibacter sp.]
MKGRVWDFLFIELNGTIFCINKPGIRIKISPLQNLKRELQAGRNNCCSTSLSTRVRRNHSPIVKELPGPKKLLLINLYNAGYSSF